MNSVTTTIPYWIDSAPLTEYPADFSWEPSDPAAVRVVFHWSPTESVNWVFSRQLLADGIVSFMNLGEGDVKIRSYSVHRTAISLSSPEGRAMIVMDTGRIEDFLRATEAVIQTDSTEEMERLNDGVTAALAEFLDVPDAE